MSEGDSRDTGGAEQTVGLISDDQQARVSRPGRRFVHAELLPQKVKFKVLGHPLISKARPMNGKPSLR